MKAMTLFPKQVLAALLLLTAAGAVAQPAQPTEPRPEVEKPASAELKARIIKLDEVIRRLDLQLNQLTWKVYLDYAEQARITPKVFSLPGLNYARLRDTVPSIDRLGKRLRAASEAYTAILRTDPQYDTIHQEYVALRGVKDSELEAANKMHYNQLYARLRATNPDYEPALERRREAERQRNMAILRYMVDYYGTQGWILPSGPLLTSYSSVMKELNGRCPEIGLLQDELSQLRRLRRELNERLLREEFGLTGREPDAGSRAEPAVLRMMDEPFR